MTNLEFLQTLKTGEEVVNFLSNNDICKQVVWNKHCLSDKYRGERGCRQCKIDWWNSEVKL